MTTFKEALDTKPHKGKIANWFRMPCDGGREMIHGVFQDHPEFAGHHGHTSWVIHEVEMPDGSIEVETRNSRYTLVGAPLSIGNSAKTPAKTAAAPGKLKLYLAGPLFTTAEREFNEQLAYRLSSHYAIWLPQENEPRQKNAKLIFKTDVSGVDWADAVIANCDGGDPDSGTAWEVGYGFARRKLIGLYRTDMRGGAADQGEMCNLMLTGSADFSIRLFAPKVPLLAQYIHENLQRFEGHLKAVSRDTKAG